jgi:membrane protease YdiL (CAAX protease family)
VSARALWARIAAGTTAAIVTLLAVPLPAPGPQRTGALVAAALGAALGILLFAALAGVRPALPSRATITPAQLSFIVGWAWVEEVLWRRLLLGALAAAAGVMVAFAAATLLFALAHREGKGTQVATGATFGIAYIGTGRLLAAFASHAVYNVLVAGSRTRAA